MHNNLSSIRFIEFLKYEITKVEKIMPMIQIVPYDKNRFRRLFVFLKFKNVFVENENANPHNAPITLTASGKRTVV